MVSVTGVICLVVVFTFSILITHVRADELSTEVFPSEDELLVALQLGLIDYDQYTRLTELSLQGIDSTNRHLLDEIPNLTFFIEEQRQLMSALDSVQAAEFVRPPRFAPSLGYVKHQLSQEGESEGRSRYRSTVHLTPWSGWEAEARLYREYSGRQRFARRYLRYRQRDGLVRLFEVGSFTTRMGLGSVVGYRGKLLSAEPEANTESWFYPDYGGMNGLHAAVVYGDWDVGVVGSHARDDNHRLQVGALDISRRYSRSEVGVTAGVTHLKDRYSGMSLSDAKVAIHGRHMYGRNYTSGELTTQFGERSGIAAMLIEGRHRLETAEVRYAGWVYGDNYFDLAGGSKSGLVRRRATLDEIQFDYSTRREGQEGGLVKTIVELGRNWQLVNYISFSQLDRDSSNLELLSGVVAELSSAVELRCDYLRKRRYQVEVGEVDDRLNQQYRLETRLSLGDWRVRSYIAFRQHNQQQDYGGLFMSTVYNSAIAGRWELWLDMRKLNIDTRQLDYAYAYIRAEQGIGSSIATAFKIAHSYRRSSRDSHDTTVTLEFMAGI